MLQYLTLIPLFSYAEQQPQYSSNIMRQKIKINLKLTIT